MTGLPHPEPAFLDFGEAGARRRIAYLARPGRAPALLWLGGLRSDMRGAKAERLDALAAGAGLGFCRFDYSGHGESSGRFADGTISRWTEEAEAMVRHLATGSALPGPLVVVGSSMGAWIALRLTERLKGSGHPVAGLLLLAPAPDFTGRLLLPRLTEAERAALAQGGFVTEPSPYSDTPTVYTGALIADGARCQVMDGPIETGCPVHIIQGMADPDVPYTHALELVSHLPADAVTLTLVRDGDHRLSREADLRRMADALAALLDSARDA